MLVFAVGAMLLLSACVSEEKLSGAEVLKKSVSAMEKIETYSFAVESSMLAIGDETYGGERMQANLSWGGDVDGPNRRMHVTATVASGNLTSNSEQYILGGRQYVKIPMFGWILNETGEEFWEDNSYSKLQPDPSVGHPAR